jgi:hypothetical protein
VAFNILANFSQTVDTIIKICKNIYALKISFGEPKQLGLIVLPSKRG